MTTIYRYRGDTAPDRVTVRDTDGEIVNITDYTFLLTVNSNKAPSGTSGQVMQVAGVITNAAGGTVVFSPTAQQADILPGKYYYDVQMTDSDGMILTILFGAYIIRQDITK